MKKTPLRKVSRSGIKITALDRLFSQLVREKANGQCQRCGKYAKDLRGLHCAHFYSRSKQCVRWDERNAACLCMGCHRFLDGNPYEKILFFERLLDVADIAALSELARVPRQINKEAMKAHLKKRLEENRRDWYGD